jgi:hypothetical protein
MGTLLWRGGSRSWEMPRGKNCFVGISVCKQLFSCLRFKLSGIDFLYEIVLLQIINNDQYDGG